jgi:carboxypeptidase C (cathepsin A)
MLSPTEDLYLFITQFLTKYDTYQKNKFFLFGESYAGHYVPAAAHRIWLGNKNNEHTVKINLKGVAVGNGMTNPLIQVRL